MLIEKERQYIVLQSYASRTENEYEVYDLYANRVGYFVERDNQYEVYHSYECTQYGDISHEEYNQIDYVDNFDAAVHMITSEIEYDMN
jgi:methenyltetrahydromethanopterin cyclohydrolase